MAFHKFSLCNTKQMVFSLSESVLYLHSQEYSNVIFKDSREIMIYMDLSRREEQGFYIN
jgi:hypothetical protein